MVNGTRPTIRIYRNFDEEQIDMDQELGSEDF